MRLPIVWHQGPQKHGLRAMKTRYKALLSPITEPEVLYVEATFGIADSTEVLEIGESRPVHAMTATMTSFLRPENRSNSSTGYSDLGSSTSPFFSGWLKLMLSVGQGPTSQLERFDELKLRLSRNCGGKPLIELNPHSC